MLFADLGVELLVALSPPELPRAERDSPRHGCRSRSRSASRRDRRPGRVDPGTAGLEGQPAARRCNGLPTGPPGGQRTRRALVVAEVALALVLLVSAGLLLRSLQRLFAVDPGFDPAQVLTMQVQTSGQRFADGGVSRRFFDEAFDAVRRIPGVDTAAFTSQLPLSGDFDRYGVRFELLTNARPRKTRARSSTR